MVTSIQLGNFFSANGKTVLGGVGGSGLDTQSLIKTLTDAKHIPADKLQDKIDANTKVTGALADFKTLLTTFQDAANFLRNPPGVQNEAQNIFKYTKAALSASGGNTASNYISVSSSPGALRQSYTISEIGSIAKARKQATDNIAIADATTASAVSATPGADQFKAGTVTLNGQSITLVAGDTLNQVAARFNVVSEQTGVQVSVVQVSAGNFRLSFSATHSGTDAAYDFDLNDSGTLTDATGVFSNFVITTTQTPANAEFKIDGVSVTRSTNSIDDVVSGVTFNLLQATPDELDDDAFDINIDIGADNDIIKGGIINFVNAYNELKVFAAKQTEVGDNGKLVDTAYLANSTAFTTTMNDINTQMTSIIEGISNGDPARLSEIGITFVDLPKSKDNPLVRNILSVDETTLASAISTDPDGVRRVFEFDLTSNNPNLQVFSHTNALSVSSFTLTINTSGTPSFTATYPGGTGPIDLDYTAINGGGGYTIKGKAGTVLEGLVLIYGSTSSATISVTATQGFADKVYNTSTDALTSDTGYIDVELDSFQTLEDKFNEEIARIDEQVERFRQQLLEKFGALEAAISRVNTLLQSLDAQDQARIAASS